MMPPLPISRSFHITSNKTKPKIYGMAYGLIAVNVVMKKVILISLMMIASFYSFSQQKTIQNLIGVWECIDQKNDRGSLEFIDTSKVMIGFMGEKRAVSDFRIDFSKTPYWFSFTVKDGEQMISVKSFLYFVDDNNIKWEVFMDDETDGSANEVVLLRRKSVSVAARL
jgi:hypothetical protein